MDSAEQAARREERERILAYLVSDRWVSQEDADEMAEALRRDSEERSDDPAGDHAANESYHKVLEENATLVTQLHAAQEALREFIDYHDAHDLDPRHELMAVITKAHVALSPRPTA